MGVVHDSPTGCPSREAPSVLSGSDPALIDVIDLFNISAKDGRHGDSTLRRNQSFA